MITKHKEVYFKTIIWHICCYLFHMGVYLATKDMDVVVYFDVNILLLTGYLTLGRGASSTVFKIISFSILQSTVLRMTLHIKAQRKMQKYIQRDISKIDKKLALMSNQNSQSIFMELQQQPKHQFSKPNIPGQCNPKAY